VTGNELRYLAQPDFTGKLLICKKSGETMREPVIVNVKLARKMNELDWMWLCDLRQTEISPKTESETQTVHSTQESQAELNCV